MIVSFDTSAELVADLTGNTELLNKAIQGLRPGGGTALYDAIFFACRDKLMQDQPLYKFRRAMVILSDGEDNQSRYTRDQALEMAQKADVVVYTVSTNITRIPTDGDKIMKYFAAETGGLPFFPFKAQDLDQSFENIANELRHQYNVLYRPEPLKTDGLYHLVDIKVRGRKDLQVRDPQRLLRSEGLSPCEIQRQPELQCNSGCRRKTNPQIALDASTEAQRIPPHNWTLFARLKAGRVRCDAGRCGYNCSVEDHVLGHHR